ncbi:aminoacyl-tRNA hydrolase [Weissella coleopterorum]|uniref:Peptidyl-tRNA hydrolase n=1 Tax=Weissella coleopterorum TaxID=2714949 RepID=A0A6G8AYF5_9LACO|nr:aminoacyl-tRNA hydrolase [Weissella coleopterorum]QIL49913.1 aminoacyl-tRNA hydrolase [Weissella coleopterorum]
MKMIVGLGNIGKEYDQTRHNVGFMTIDAFAQELNINFKQDGPHRAFVAEGWVGTDKVLLVKPTTYMNLSGEAVAPLMKYYHLNLADLLIVQDDMDMELGRLRLRSKGSAGGHNGIKSIINHLGTQDFNRLKFGIAHPKHEKQAVINFVLGKFDKNDAITVDQSIQVAKKMMQDFVQGKPVDQIMNQYN